MLDLNKLIGKIKKHFIESTLDAEFDEHMGYQKHDQNYKDVSNNYIDIKVQREQLSTFEPKIVKRHEKNISRIEDKYFFYIQKGYLLETFRKQHIKCFIVI